MLTRVRQPRRSDANRLTDDTILESDRPLPVLLPTNVINRGIRLPSPCGDRGTPTTARRRPPAGRSNSTLLVSGSGLLVYALTTRITRMIVGAVFGWVTVIVAVLTALLITAP